MWDRSLCCTGHPKEALLLTWFLLPAEKSLMRQGRSPSQYRNTFFSIHNFIELKSVSFPFIYTNTFFFNSGVLKDY